ncbi:MAG: 5-formyltetrahydrofolate cyclo-ligase [Bacilli bacterium]|nr:5-formyltetrahydrofolate cyclo-ligase [Bacilli bacterium]
MKRIARKKAKQARSLLSEEERSIKSNEIVEQLIPLLADKKTIAIYIPIENEVDVTSLMFLYQALGVPKIRNQEDLDFFLIHDVQELEKGTFNILEPTSSVWMAPDDFDAIIVPLVAFDENKNRIGQGKGYYDRYLKQTQALKIGVAFDVQKVNAFPVDEYDVPLDYIVTETKIY